MEPEYIWIMEGRNNDNFLGYVHWKDDLGQDASFISKEKTEL